MFIRSREFSPSSILSADVAVVGAGPAGITLALELARGGLDVILVESAGADGFAPDASSAVMDPFEPQPTLVINCDILEPSTGQPYTRDPRSTAKRAAASAAASITWHGRPSNK